MISNLRDAELQIEAIKRQQNELIRKFNSISANGKESQKTEIIRVENEIDSVLTVDKNTVIHKLLHLFDRIKAKVADIDTLNLTEPLPISSGGTGADNATDARTNLDVYSKAEVDQKDIQIGVTGVLTVLTTTPQDIPGTELTLTKTGLYLLIAFMDMGSNGIGDNSAALLGALNINGIDQTKNIVKTANTSSGFLERATVGQSWLFILTAGAVVKLRASKTGGTGSSGVYGHTTLIAQWQGN